MSENTRVYRVTGMTCSHCANAVTQEVSALPEVSEVQVDLATGEVTVNSTRPLTDKEMAAALYEAGYDLAS